MYGYVRPLKGELKVSEYEQFKAMYCGLCHRLKERCGFAARFVVNYDFTFLAMLLSEADCVSTKSCRCAASPIKKKKCCCSDPALDTAADYSVILAHWKLRDALADDGFWSRFGSRIVLVLLHRAYARAKATAPGFDECARENLDRLSRLEKEKCASIDAPADCFARILECIAEGAAQESRRRILSQIFYHVGRIIYVLDAVNDLPEDFADERYNPLVYRFSKKDAVLTPEEKESVLNTLQLSENILLSAYALLPEGTWSPIIQNILFEGLPAVSGLVMNGKWREIRKLQKEKMNGAEL